MSFIIRNISAGSPQPDVVLPDIGLTIPGAGNGGPDFDAITEQPNDIAMSTDLASAITGGFLIVLDPLDGTTPLTVAQSLELVSVHNDPHYRIRGADINQLDDVDVTGAQPGDVLQLHPGSPQMWMPTTVNDLINGALLDDLGDVNTPNVSGSPSAGWTDGEIYVLVGNSSNEVDVLPINATGGSPAGSILCEPVEDIVGNMIANRSTHTDITVVYTDGAGTCDGTLDFSVDDVFLRNTGDVLESGTLTIAPGATLNIAGESGSPLQAGSITIGQNATATIATPTGNFTNPDDIVNKEYVDSIAGGLDWKESVRAGTTPAIGDVGGTFTAAGSPPGTNDTITGALGVVDDVVLAVGDRVLIKDQTDPKENGIWVVTALGVAGSPQTADYRRADDQNGNPDAEVSAGNAVFVEQGTVNTNSGWVVTGDGILTLGTDDINWTQFAGAGNFTAEQGLAQVGTSIALDLDDLTPATIALEDSIGFHDDDGTPQANTSTQTYNTTVQDFVDDLGIAYGIVNNGFVVRGAGSPGPYGSVTIVASTLDDELGILVLNGDGTTGNPTIGLDIKGLDAVAGSPTIDTTDRVPVWDSDADKNVYYTVGQIATALATTNSFATWAGSGSGTTGGPNVATSGSDTMTIDGGVGISAILTSGTDTIQWNLDFTQIPSVGSPSTIDNNDEIIVNDGGTIVKTTIGDLLSNVSTDVFKTVSADTGSVVASGTEDTLNLRGGEGIATKSDGSPKGIIFDIDFTSLEDTSGSPPATPSGDTEIIVNIDGNNYSTTINELLAGAINGGNGISVTTDASPAQTTIDLDICGVNGGNVANLTGSSSVAVCVTTDASPLAQATVSYTLDQILDTLDVPSGITGTGIVVKTDGSPDTYATRNIVESTTAGEEGAQVNNGDGVSGDIEIGVDIDNLTPSADDMAATDEFITFDGTNNVSMSGQQVADGVSTILGFTIKSIGGSGSPGQTQLFIQDTSRGSPFKELSVQESALTFSDNIVQNNGWVEIGNAVDALSGYIVPMNATIVRVTAHTSSKPAAAKDLDLYVNGSVNTAGVVTFAAGAGESSFTDITLNIDVDAGDKIRLRGAATGGQIEDTVVTFWLRWRAD